MTRKRYLPSKFMTNAMSLKQTAGFVFFKHNSIKVNHVNDGRVFCDHSIPPLKAAAYKLDGVLLSLAAPFHGLF